MKAAVSSEQGLVMRDVPAPKPKPADLLIKVKAIALNRADLGAAKGDASHGAAVGTPIGSEYSGEVIEVGAQASGFKVGDRVMCYNPGAYAEIAACDHSRALPIPQNLSFEQAATLPIGLNTLHDALVTNGRLKAGESVLVQGASSGVGLLGLRIAKFKGAKLVIGSSTNPERRAKLKEFGADLAIDTSDPSWPDQVLKATDGKGVNLIIDQVSGSVAVGNLKATAILGRIVNVGRLGGGKAEFDFDLHAARRISYIGVTHRTRSVDELREETRVMWKDLKDAITAGKLHLPIDKTFPLDQAAAAQAHMKANQHFGKILLLP